MNVKCHFSWQVATLGEVQVSLFVAGAALCECLNVRLGAKRCIFQKKMLLVSSKNNLGCEAGCGLVGSFSDRPLSLEMTFQVFSQIF